MFTHKNGDFGAISVTEQSCAAPIYLTWSAVTYRIGVYTHLPESISSMLEKLSGIV